MNRDRVESPAERWLALLIEEELGAAIPPRWHDLTSAPVTEASTVATRAPVGGDGDVAGEAAETALRRRWPVAVVVGAILFVLGMSAFALWF